MNLFIAWSFTLLICFIAIKAFKSNVLLLKFWVIFYALFYLPLPLLQIFDLGDLDQIFKFEYVSLTSREVGIWHLIEFVSFYFVVHGSSTKLFYIGGNSLLNFTIDNFYRRSLNLLFWILIVLFPLLLILLLHYTNTVLSQGYLSLFIDGGPEKGIILEGILSIFVTLLAILLSNPYLQRSRFNVVLFLYILVNLILAIGGSRGQLIISLAFSLYLLIKYHDFKVTKLKIFILTAIILLLPVLAVYKNPSYYGSGLIFKLMLQELGNSSLIVPYLMHFKNLVEIWNFPAILGPLQIFPFDGQSDVYLSRTYGLGHHLTAFLNRSSYFLGEGIGSSYIGELCQLAMFLTGSYFFVIPVVAIGSYFLGVFISLVDFNSRTFLVIRLLIFFLVPHLFFTPRTSYLPSVVPLVKYLFYLFVLFCIINLLYVKISNNYSNLRKK